MTIIEYVLAQLDARKRAEMRRKPKLQRPGMISIAGDLGCKPIDRIGKQREAGPMYHDGILDDGDGPTGPQAPTGSIGPQGV